MEKIIILISLIIALPATAETYKSKFGSRVVIDGDSSVH